MRTIAILALAWLGSSCCGVGEERMVLQVRPNGNDLVTVALGQILDPDRGHPTRPGHAVATGVHDVFVELQPNREGISVFGHTLVKDSVYVLDCRGLNAEHAEVRLFRPLGDTWDQIERVEVEADQRVKASYEELSLLVQADREVDHGLVMFLHAGAPWTDQYNGLRIGIRSSSEF